MKKLIQTTYTKRFQGCKGYRKEVWKVLIDQLFAPYLAGVEKILELGPGHGEFLNQIQCKERWAVDLNPDSKKYLDKKINILSQASEKPWNIAPNKFDLIFTSNFFEHLRNKDALVLTLVQAYRTLKPGGKLVALGPNIRKLPGSYWDFWDHYLPLSELSLAEVGRICGFTIEKAIPATLPYSMSLGFQPPLWAVRLYLVLPFLWRFFGKQFLVVMKK